MSLFICENPECRAVENTALAWWWICETGTDNKAVCSECREGKWHGLFEKQTYDPEVHRVQFDGRTHLTDER